MNNIVAVKATPPNQQQLSILADYFNNYKRCDNLIPGIVASMSLGC
jgi:hypothetical protein